MKRENRFYFKKILEAYEKNFFYLPLNKIGHFFERAYAVTGNKKYENILAYYVFIQKIDRVKKNILALESKKLGSFERPKGKVSKRKSRRLKLYEQSPEIPFFNNLLVDLFFLKRFGVDKGFLKKDFQQIIKYLKKQDFTKIYLNEPAIKYDSSFTFNSCFFLKHLKISKIDKGAEALLRHIYFTKKLTLKRELSDWEYFSLIYSMTHIIIADSKYYERNVEGHGWIIEYFNQNTTEIIKRVSLDILAEVGICFKLCKKEKRFFRAFNKITKYLKKNIDLGSFSNWPWLVKREHTNSILMILFSGGKMFKGPNLSKNPVFNKLNQNNE